MQAGRLLTLSFLTAVLPGIAAADDDVFYERYGQPFEVAQSNTTTQQQRGTLQAQPALTPETQHWSIALGGLYTERQGEAAGWAPNAEVNYSPTDRLQLHAMLPYAFDRLSGGPTHWGIGDFETGVRYRFVDDDPNGWTPAIAAYPLVDFPTGDKNRNLGTGSTHAFLPLWFSKSFGSWTPFAGGGYWINPGTNNKNWTLFSAGVVKTVNDTLSLTGEIFNATSSKIGIPDQTGIDFGARVNFNANNHFVLTLGTGIVNARETDRFTGLAAYVYTF
ncbi:MAG TPA: hypothetical protein VLV50_12890 [Stellaceae bacterium]|nr:hypothetical protein [Stellaceae bacterium]